MEQTEASVLKTQLKYRFYLIVSIEASVVCVLGIIAFIICK